MVMLPTTEPEASPVFGLLKRGHYPAVLEEITLLNGPKGWWAKVMARLEQNRTVYGGVYFTEASVEGLQRTCKGLGLAYRGIDMTPDMFSIEAKGRTCIVYVDISKDKNGIYEDKNVIKGYLPSDADVECISLNGSQPMTATTEGGEVPF